MTHTQVTNMRSLVSLDSIGESIFISFIMIFSSNKMRQLLLLRQSLRSVRFSSYSVSSEATISHESTENVDITIAGGGLVGSAMALAFGTISSFIIRFIFI